MASILGRRQKKLQKRINAGQSMKAAERTLSEEEDRVTKAQKATTPQVSPSEKAAATQTLKDVGAFEEVTPSEVPLKEEIATDVPFLSPSSQALSQTLPEGKLTSNLPSASLQAGLSIFNLIRKKGVLDEALPKKITGAEAFPELSDETLREAALRQIQRESFNKGVSRREKFGSEIEAIPAVGRLGNTWVGDLIEAPSANAEQVIREVNIIKEDASTGQEKVRNGLEDPFFGLEQAREMEEDIASLEGRLSLLISTSARLQANTDEVNRIQREILSAKKKVSRYRQASSFGVTASTTGTGRVVPTDEQIFFELKGGK